MKKIAKSPNESQELSEQKPGSPSEKRYIKDQIAFEISSQSIKKPEPKSPRKRKYYVIPCKQQGVKSPTGKLSRKSAVFRKSRAGNEILDFDGLESPSETESEQFENEKS